MTEKRFTDNGVEEIENQSFTDNLTGKIYWIDHGLDEIVDLLNQFAKENEELKKDATTLIYANQDYRHENEQLKADKQRLIDFIKKEFPKSHKHILEGFND